MSTNPYETPSSSGNSGGNPPAKSAASIGRALWLAAIGLLLIVLFSPVIRHGFPRNAREAARKAQCINNLKQITLGLLNYEATYGCFPPAYTVDANGKRLHSWRALILPFIEKSANPIVIDYTKPWDDPVNQEARDSVAPVYQCPSSWEEDPLKTSYLAVITSGGVFTGGQGTATAAIHDGRADTILVVDVDVAHGVHWMSPEDVDESWLMNLEQLKELPHADRINVAFCDGRASSLDVTTDKAKLRASLTIAGDDNDVLKDSD